MGWEDADGRCDCAGGMYHPGGFVCSSTLWHPPSCLRICTRCDSVALLHLQHWCVQCHHVQPAYISSSVPVLHVQLLQEMWQGRMGFSRRHRPLHHRLVLNLLFLLSRCSSFLAARAHHLPKILCCNPMHQPIFIRTLVRNSNISGNG